MHTLRHFYYQNKEKIWKVTLIIVCLLGLLYYMNYLAGKENEDKQNKQIEQDGTSIYYSEENKTHISDKSAISGSKVTEDEVEKINSTISKFLQYCKNKNVQEAYNMISKDCKENEYNTLEKFQERYINLKFSNTDVYEIENWIDNTYKVTISEDILATGNLNKEKQIEYITIVKEDNIEKLNINGYIGTKDINKKSSNNKINITVVSKKVYLDYEEYEFKIENLSNTTIKLDSLQNPGTIYLESATGVKYNAYTHELYDEDLEIKSNHTINVNIKFARQYSKNAYNEKIIFNEVILDYSEYKNIIDKETYKNTCNFIIDI